MADKDIGTTPTGEDETDTASATQPSKTPAQATQDDEQVTLSKKDYQELVSQRDKNFSTAETTNARLEQIEIERARERYIDNQLLDPDFKAKYPDVKKEDLSHALDEEDVEAIAKRTQRRIEDIRQDELQKLQTPDITPERTPEEQADFEKKLKKGVDKGEVSDGFEQYVNSQLK